MQFYVSDRIQDRQKDRHQKLIYTPLRPLHHGWHIKKFVGYKRHNWGLNYGLE